MFPSFKTNYLADIKIMETGQLFCLYLHAICIQVFKDIMEKSEADLIFQISSDFD